MGPFKLNLDSVPDRLIEASAIQKTGHLTPGAGELLQPQAAKASLRRTRKTGYLYAADQKVSFRRFFSPSWSHSGERQLVAWCATRYSTSVIKSFKHKGLHRYYETGSKAGIQAKHAGRLRLQLAALDTARVVEDMDVPGYRLHSLKGRAKNRWSICVSGNWRLTFEFKDGNAYVLDYEDYH